LALWEIRPWAYVSFNVRTGNIKYRQLDKAYESSEAHSNIPYYTMQLFIHSHFAWSSLCQVIIEKLIILFLYAPCGSYCRVGGPDAGGYVAAQKLPTSVISIHGTAAKERSYSLVQFLQGSWGYRIRNRDGIKCYCLRNPFEYFLNPLPLCSQTWSRYLHSKKWKHSTLLNS
jgi:hypothetical protein